MSSPQVDNPIPTVLALRGRTVAADWGSTVLISELVGAAPSGTPEAEVWFGAHASHPSSIVWQGRERPIIEIGSIEPPTFLVKLIAVAAPLSIQVHPDDATAAAGFAAETSTLAQLDAGSRLYADASGKPEMLRAITAMRVLCGLRPAAASRELLAALAGSGCREPLSLLAQGDTRLGDVVALLLRASQDQLRSWFAELRAGAEDLLRVAEQHREAIPPGTLRLARLFLDLEGRHPQDPGVLVALLLEDRDLMPGEALYVAPGVPHAYLSGLGVEVMASSDNVLRAGMTAKRVDVDAFLAVLDASAGGGIAVGSLSDSMAETSGWRRYLTPSEAFVVDEADVRGALRVERTGSGPAVLLCIAGSLTVVAADSSRVELTAGAAALLERGLDPVEVRGGGSIVHVRAGSAVAGSQAAGGAAVPTR